MTRADDFVSGCNCRILAGNGGSEGNRGASAGVDNRGNRLVVKVNLRTGEKVKC